MKRTNQRKCLCCSEFFHPDARNLRHQQYCTNAACRKASKVASQRRWLDREDNHDYFSGPLNVARVQAWRVAHPGYWRGAAAKAGVALQDDSTAQVIDSNKYSVIQPSFALQDILSAQPIVLIGLIAHITDCTLQEDISATLGRLIQLGQDILQGKNRDGNQAGAGAGALAARSAAIQLDRSAPGA